MIPLHKFHLKLICRPQDVFLPITMDSLQFSCSVAARVAVPRASPRACKCAAKCKKSQENPTTKEREVILMTVELCKVKKILLSLQSRQGVA